MEKKILEVNVDDLNMGGVYGLVKNVIINNENRNIQIDIASIEHFANRANIDMFNSIGTHVFYVGYEGNKLLKQIKCFLNLRKLIKKGNYEYISNTHQPIIAPGIFDKVQEMKKYKQHYETSTFDHCYMVSYYCYKVCKKLKLDYKSAARAGMLHDFFLYDWRIKNGRKGLHAFTHGKTACKNASELFELSEKEKDFKPDKTE